MRYFGRRDGPGIMIARHGNATQPKRSYYARVASTCLEVASLPAPVADKQAALGLPHPGAVLLHPHAMIEFELAGTNRGAAGFVPRSIVSIFSRKSRNSAASAVLALRSFFNSASSASRA